MIIVGLVRRIDHARDRHLRRQFRGVAGHVLHVARDASELAAQMAVTGVVDPANQADDYHRWLAELLGERGPVRRVEAVRIGSDVAETIRHYAESNEVDLVVMATHGRT